MLNIDKMSNVNAFHPKYGDIDCFLDKINTGDTRPLWAEAGEDIEITRDRAKVLTVISSQIAGGQLDAEAVTQRIHQFWRYVLRESGF